MEATYIYDANDDSFYSDYYNLVLLFLKNLHLHIQGQHNLFFYGNNFLQFNFLTGCVVNSITKFTFFFF